jgi:hypothetical protein
VINFSLSPDDFSTIGTEQKKVFLPGKFEISIGGAQPGTKAETKSNILQGVVSIQ